MINSLQPCYHRRIIAQKLQKQEAYNSAPKLLNIEIDSLMLPTYNMRWLIPTLMSFITNSEDPEKERDRKDTECTYLLRTPAEMYMELSRAQVQLCICVDRCCTTKYRVPKSIG